MMVYIRMLTNQVVLAARDHYNCSTLRGPLLENEGSELTQRLVIAIILLCLSTLMCAEYSSHWEIRVLFPEIMNGILYDQLAS